MDSISHDGISIRPPEVSANDDFNHLYEQINMLPTADKVDFLVHDIANMTGSLQMIPIRACPEMAGKIISDFSGVATEFNEKRAEAKQGTVTAEEGLGVDCLPMVDLYVDKGRKCIAETIQRICESADEFKEEKIQQLEALSKYLDITRAAVVFIQQPTDLHFNVMDIVHTDLRAVSSLFVNEVNAETVEQLNRIPQTDLTGPEAVIIFNLLHNAQRHQVKGTELTIAENLKGNIDITNESVKSLPAKNGLKEPGEHGHTGFGVYLSRMMAAKKNLTIAADQKQIETGNYLVTLTLEK